MFGRLDNASGIIRWLSLACGHARYASKDISWFFGEVRHHKNTFMWTDLFAFCFFRRLRLLGVFILT